MDLVKKVGKVDGRYKGEFICPSCNDVVIRPLSDGTKNKSCGKQHCKIKMSPRKHTSSIDYYRAFSEKYRDIKSKYILCDEWSTMDKFISSMHSRYVEARMHGDKISFVTTSEIPSPSNSYWKVLKGTAKPRLRGIRHFDVDYSNDIANGVYHVKMIADMLKKDHNRVLKRMRRLQSITDFGDTQSITVSITHNDRTYKSKTESLSKHQYELLLSVLTVTSNKRVSNNIYLMRSLDKVKIGIAQDVEKRRKSLYYSSPVEVVVIFHKKMDDARKIERELHAKYSNLNSHGEWFTLTDEQVQEIIKYLDNL